MGNLVGIQIKQELQILLLIRNYMKNELTNIFSS